MWFWPSVLFRQTCRKRIFSLFIVLLTPSHLGLVKIYTQFFATSNIITQKKLQLLCYSLCGKQWLIHLSGGSWYSFILNNIQKNSVPLFACNFRFFRKLSFHQRRAYTHFSYSSFCLSSPLLSFHTLYSLVGWYLVVVSSVFTHL